MCTMFTASTTTACLLAQKKNFTSSSRHSAYPPGKNRPLLPKNYLGAKVKIASQHSAAMMQEEGALNSFIHQSSSSSSKEGNHEQQPLPKSILAAGQVQGVSGAPPPRKLSKARNVHLPAIKLHEIPLAGTSPHLIRHDIQQNAARQHNHRHSQPPLGTSSKFPIPRPTLMGVERTKNKNHEENESAAEPQHQLTYTLGLGAVSPVGGILRSRSADDFSQLLQEKEKKKRSLLLADKQQQHSDSFNSQNMPSTEGNSAGKNGAATGDLLDIRIFFPTGKAVQFPVEHGANALVETLLRLVADYLGIDVEVAEEALALWLVSPLLELQLKPYHVAYEVHSKWLLFLNAYTEASEEQAALDEPLLVVRRNFLLSLDRERQFCADYERLTEVLYWDAKEQYLSGRYLVDVNSAIHLAALQMAIEFGPCQRKPSPTPATNTASDNTNDDDVTELLREHIHQLVPAQHLSTIRSFHLFGVAALEFRAGLEPRVVEEYAAVSRDFANKDLLRREYLDALRTTPFYGAAFFTGTAERRHSSLLTSTVMVLGRWLMRGRGGHMDVLVGINRDYITVSDPHRHELLLVQSIASKPWLRSPDSDDEEQIPSLLFKFPPSPTATPGSTPAATTAGGLPKNAAAAAMDSDDGGGATTANKELMATTKLEDTNKASNSSKTLGRKESLVERGRVKFFKRRKRGHSLSGNDPLASSSLSKNKCGENGGGGGNSSEDSGMVELGECQLAMISRLLQVFSKQTVIMENLLDVLCADCYGAVYEKIRMCQLT